MTQSVDDRGYYVAQICVRGHVVDAFGSPSVGYCGQCGANVITCCSKCNKSLLGYHVTSLPTSSINVPSFCEKCGKPFPWMEDKLNTAKELLYHLEDISPDEKSSLWELLDYVLSTDSDLLKPKAILFREKLKSAGKRLSSEAKEALYSIVAKAVAEKMS
jgi:hypothetical protein